MGRKRDKVRSSRSGRGDPKTLRTARSPVAELAGLRGPFLAWLRQAGVPASVDANALWDDVAAVVSLAATGAGLTDLHVWTVEQIDTLAAVAEDDESDALAALPLLVAFLGDTGRWSGTADEFEAVLAAADAVGSPRDALLAELAGVEVDPAAEDAAVRELPLVTRTEALLRFLLPSRPVTGTGALRRADTGRAAELVGLDLGGRRPRSMWDVPRLAGLWDALAAAGLLIVTDTEATPSPLAYGWVAGDAEQGRQAAALLVGAYLADVLTTQPELPWLPDPLDALLPVLAAAALDRPMPTAVAVEESVGSSDVEGALETRRLLDQLADDGVLHVSDTVTTVPALRGVLARVTEAVLRAEAEPQSSAVLGLPAPDPGLTGRTWRLRIDLVDAQPPVWREVLVDPGITLDALHEVIQRVFDWEDYHLHEFTVTGPGRRTRRFAPARGDDWPGFGEPAAEESRVRLSQLVGPGKRTLHYRYDFGDSWDHRLTVVGDQPAGDDVPRCLAGSGAAPAEDSGGVWGWTEKVQAAGDPRHPEHRDAREWLDLTDGETLDPIAFDIAKADRRLAMLRRRAARRE